MPDVPVKRCFIAIPLDEVVRTDLAELMRGLDLPGLRATAAENLHLTLKFLGDVEDREAPRLIEAVRRAALDIGSFELAATGLAYLPNERRPRVFALSLTLPEALGRLVERLEEGLEPIGFPREGRAYRPHITLGRFRPPRGRQARGKRGEASRRPPPPHTLQTPETGFIAREVQLVQSVLGAGGPIYTPMARIPLE